MINLIKKIVQNRWASRVKEQAGDGYELFGQKIAVNKPDGEKLKNKFTLELTSPDFVDIVSSKGNNNSSSPISPGNALAKQFENEDGVLMTSDKGYLAFNIGEKTPPRSGKSSGNQVLLRTPTNRVELNSPMGTSALKSGNGNYASEMSNNFIFAALPPLISYVYIGTNKQNLTELEEEDIKSSRIITNQDDLLHQSAANIEGLLEHQVLYIIYLLRCLHNILLL